MSNPRVIGGKARGIRLKPVPGDTTRPVTDRVKEAVFNIISSDIIGSTLLDVFGGTGSIGIEALSRGAAYVRFLDINNSAVATIRTNLHTTHLEVGWQVIQADALSYLTQPADRCFDYIYVAPPQYKNIWIQTLEILDSNPSWLGADTWIIVQIHPLEYQVIEFSNFGEIDQRKYGSTVVVIYQPFSDDISTTNSS